MGFSNFLKDKKEMYFDEINSVARILLPFLCIERIIKKQMIGDKIGCRILYLDMMGVVKKYSEIKDECYIN